MYPFPKRSPSSFQEIFKGLKQTVMSPHSQKEGNCHSPHVERAVLGAPSHTMQVAGRGGVAPGSYLLFPHTVEDFFLNSHNLVNTSQKKKNLKESAESLTLL